MAATLAAALPFAAGAQQNNRDLADRIRTTDHSVEGYVSDHALQMQYVRNLRVEDVGPLEARAGVFYNEDRDLILVGDILSVLGDQSRHRAFQLKVGSRVFGALLTSPPVPIPELRETNQDVFGISFGGMGEYFFSRDGRTSVQLSLFYAPNILTFGEADNISDVGLNLRSRVTDGTDVFVGYRQLKFNAPLGDRAVDDNLHIGFRKSF